MYDDHEFFKIMGNGKADIGYLLFQSICFRLEHARIRHPDWQSKDIYYAKNAIAGEFEELEYAIENESQQRQFDEALDVIATAIRFANWEFEK